MGSFVIYLPIDVTQKIMGPADGGRRESIKNLGSAHFKHPVGAGRWIFGCNWLRLG
jgi:hypothetical protein